MKKLFLIILFLFHSLSYSKEITEFTVMHAPGGVSDIVSRYIAKEIPDKSYVVVNRPGGSGRISLNHLMNEKTMMLATMVQVFVTNPLNFKDLGHDPYKDIEVLATIGVMPSALVCNTKVRIESVEEFRKTEKSLSFGVGSLGTSEHLATEIFLSKFKNNHIIVPYSQGGIAGVKDLLGGHIDCMFTNYPTIKSQLKNDNLKILLTSHPIEPSIPAWNNVYKENFPYQSYLSIIVPKSMDKNNKDKIKNNLNIVFKNSNYVDGLLNLGIFPKSSTDSKIINESLDHMREVQEFIINKKVKISY
jgi:tripartite-type tricarboxylate transporter receptor subunit TctC